MFYVSCFMVMVMLMIKLESRLMRVNANDPVELSKFLKTGIISCIDILSKGGIIDSFGSA